MTDDPRLSITCPACGKPMNSDTDAIARIPITLFVHKLCGLQFEQGTITPHVTFTPYPPEPSRTCNPPAQPEQQ